MTDLEPCAWCGQTSVQRVTVEQAVFTAVGGVRRLKKHAVEADVCAAHAAMVARNQAERDAEADAKRDAKRAKR